MQGNQVIKLQGCEAAGVDSPVLLDEVHFDFL